MKIGLTLGKFAPLHHGHQYLIETALKEVDELIVIIYESSDIISIPLQVRANWIRKLYPSVKVIEGWNGPSAMGDTPEIKRLQEDYVLGLLNYQKITHFYSSEFYGDHMSRALGAVNRVVDESRKQVSISASAIRQNFFANRKFISSTVYKDLIANIVFLGAPSTGKTTIAETLAKEYNTVWMPEYGREYWEEHQVNRRLSKEQLVEIGERHLQKEEQLIQQSNQYLFTDTNAITTYMFSMYYHGEADERLIQLAKEVERRYDLIFLCDTDIPYDDTWDRSGDVNRKLFQEKIIEDLSRRNLDYIMLSGNLQERKKKVIQILNSFKKYH
jgi:HTH-type transcriptional regulator, transcriptional repressor of NAD biosynthesis genes